MKTYTVPAHNWAKLEKSILRLNAQLAKANHSPVTYAVVNEVALPDPDRQGAAIPCKVVNVDGTEPEVNGWHFLARLVHTSDGNIVRAVPGFEVLPSFRDLPPNCDHCGAKRQRRDTYIVRHDNGEQRQVGSTCLRDFLSADPKSVCRATDLFLEAFDLFDAATNVRWLGGSGLGEPYRIFTMEYLAHVAHAVEVSGYFCTRSAAKVKQIAATADMAYNDMFAQHADEERRTPTEANCRMAEDAVAHVRSCYEEIIDADDMAGMLDAVVYGGQRGGERGKTLSDFEHNILAVARAQSIEPRLIGIAAFIIEHYRRHLRSTAEAETKRVSEHVGTLGERLRDVPVKLVFSRHIEGAVYDKTVLKFEDDKGSVYVWFASGFQDYAVDSYYMLTGTVKKHDEYKGAKQTVLSRCDAVEAAPQNA